MLEGIKGFRPAMLEQGNGDVQQTDEGANSWREFLKATGVYPYYINPDGFVVHSLDPDAKERIAQGAVAVLPVKGTMVREAWTLEELWYGLVSSDRLTKFIRSVAQDARIVGCVATVNCPGGMVSGTEKLGKAWADLGKTKRTVMHVDDLAASAAYWFGAGSGSIMLDGQTSAVGSVGVMLSFYDWIAFYEKIGIPYREIYANESGTKNEEWRALREQNDPSKYKASLDITARLFQSVVKQGRGAKLNAAEPDALTGSVYDGDAAIAAGLADGIGDLDDCIRMVRSGTATGNAPEASKPQDQVPPALPGTEDDDATANQQPQTMKFAQRMAALLAGLFTSSEAVTAEDIAAANTELAAKEITGVAVVSTAEQTRLAEAATLVSTAEKAQASAETARAAADAARVTAEAATAAAQASLTSMNEAVASVAAANGVVVAEGANALEAIGAALTANAAAITAGTTALAEANATIAKLKNEDAPIEGAEGVVNKEGDTKTPVNDGAAKVDQWLQED